MSKIENVQAVDKLLAPYVPLMKHMTGKDITLERMVPVMNALGNPQNKLKIIHIAGTSGKTSTAYYIAALLTVAGCKTGLTVSPHVDSVLERIQINMQPLDTAVFKSELETVISLLRDAGIEPTYFELLIAFAYWYFEKAGVDYAVIETGMGGMDDATNIAQNADKICVITDIGFDHMHVLGNTVEAITRQKAGIIHTGNHVLMYEQAPEIMAQIRSRIDDSGATLQIVTPALDRAKSGLPDYQLRNYHLAQQAYAYITERDGLRPLDQHIIEAAASVRVPGRMEVRTYKEKTIVLDGAHNEQKTQAFVNSFRALYPNQKVPVLLSLKQGKELQAVLPLLKPITSELIITEFTSSQDLPIASIDAQELTQAARAFHFDKVQCEPDVARAFALLTGTDSKLAIVTGSFYLIGQLRAQFPELTSE